jgi:hypothetical protein
MSQVLKRGDQQTKWRLGALQLQKAGKLLAITMAID